VVDIAISFAAVDFIFDKVIQNNWSNASPT
jgi:hypothetical protein